MANRTIEFGTMIAPGPLPGKPINSWMDILDASLPKLKGYLQSVWMSDHFFWHDRPTYEGWTVVSYLAARFPDFDFGGSVFGQTYRNPALLAKAAATLQMLTNGRFIMGIGAGWKEDEYIAYGYPFPSAKIRLEQLAETLEIMKRLWTQPGRVTYQGKHYQVVDAYCEPKPTPPPIIMVGGGGKTTMKVAAQHADWWNLSDQTLDVLKEKLTVLRQHCETVGRDPATLRVTWLGRLSVAKTQAEAHGRALTVGREHYGGWSVDSAFIGTPQQIVDKVGAFVEAGVDYFIWDILNLPDPDVIGMFTEEIVAKVNR